VGTGAVVTGLLAYLLHLPLALATGLYAGSLTCTPALAAAIDTLNRVLPEAAPLASVGYGIAYPYSMIGMVLLIQFLPRLLKRSIKTEEQLWLAEKAIEAPGLQARQFRVTNVNIDGQTVAELNPRRLAFGGNEVRPIQELESFLQTRALSIVERCSKCQDLNDRPVDKFSNRREHALSHKIPGIHSPTA